VKIYTDEGSALRLLTENMAMRIKPWITSAKEHVRGDVHTITIEAFCANVKRGIKGIYVWVLKKHLQTYLRKFEYRHNLRRLPYLTFDCLLQAFLKVQVG